MSRASEIIIVSGLPRSGTSLMMQMLSAGGIPLLVDGIREADVDNPHGYYEFEKVKRTKGDPSWLSDARGKAVKMISQLLYDLPGTETYRIIFMRREMAEVVASQEQMLIRRGQPIPSREAIASAFEIHLQKLSKWLSSQQHMTRLDVNYNKLIEVPDTQLDRVAAFLGRPLDTSAMRAAIDVRLYRHREPSDASDG